MNLAAVAAAAVIFSQFLLHNVIKMLCDTDKRICTVVNYRGKTIPAIGGIAFIPISLAFVFLLILQDAASSRSYLGYLALVLGMGLSGVVDDLVGDKNIKGLVNHIKSTMAGKMTTGFLKAFTGFFMSCIVSFGMSNSYIDIVVNTLIISLFANTLNLFDLRPGRAVKVFLAASLVLITAFAGRISEAAPLIMLNLAAWLYIRYDLKELCMLGDTGANILGVSLGYYSALLPDLASRLIILAILIVLNAAAERLSISAIIDRNKFFSYLDNLGRGQTGNR